MAILLPIVIDPAAQHFDVDQTSIKRYVCNQRRALFPLASGCLDFRTDDPAQRRCSAQAVSDRTSTGPSPLMCIPTTSGHVSIRHASILICIF